MPAPADFADPDAAASGPLEVLDSPGWILVIDDQVGVRMFIRRVLTREGYDVADAPNLEVAYPAYQDLPVRLLILDLILPDREMTTAFKQARRCFPRAEVIAISGGGRCGSESLLSIAERLGAAATLAKPFRCERLLETVGNLWGPSPTS